MKRNWLIYILACSMFLNMGIIASFAYWRSGTQPGLSPPFRELTCSLNLGLEQRQMIRSLLPEHRQRIDKLRRGLAQRRQELYELLQEGETSWPAIQDKIREIRDLQSKLELEMVQFFLGFRNCLKPGQKIVFTQYLQNHLAGRHGNGRRHGSGDPRGRPGTGTN